jgi:hypothetical protein
MVDPSTGDFTTVFNSNSYNMSFIDSGSNGLYFLDSTTTGIPVCSDNSAFYCPSASQSLTATNQGANGSTGNVNFIVGNADMLSNGIDAAINGLAGPNSGAFDWGLPFFYGRNVYTAIEGQSTPGGTGPYWAY